MRCQVRSQRPWRLPVGAAATAILLAGGALVGTPAARADGPVYRVLSSKCYDRNNDNGKGEYTWWGAGRWAGDKATVESTMVRGRMYRCVTKFTYLNDGDSYYDYYGVVMDTYWYLDRGSGSRGFAAKMNHQVTSSQEARSSVFGATNSYTSRSDCNDRVSIGLQVGPVSLSTNMAICESYSVVNRRESSVGAWWEGTRAGGLEHVSTAYIQKVHPTRQTGLPVFTVTFGVPRYTVVWDSSEGHWVPRENLVTLLNKV